MKIIVLIVFLLSLRPGCSESSKDRYVIQTSLGNIEVVVYATQAPRTTSNFVDYVEANAYSESSFFRVTNEENESEREIKIQVIQGGNIKEGAERDPIEMEGTVESGLRHRKGALSMARSSKDTATSQFFICLRDEPELDEGGGRHPDGFGFAVFGQVVEGMEIVEAINALPNEDQRLLEPVEILNIEKR